MCQKFAIRYIFRSEIGLIQTSIQDVISISESEAKAEARDKSISMHVPTFYDWLVLPFLFPTPTTQFSLDRKLRSSKRYQKNQNAVVSGSLKYMLLITTPTSTPSLLKTSLK